MGRERRDPELARQRGEPVLGRPDPLGAHLHDVAAADVLVQDPAAHAITGLHDDDRGALGRQPAGRREACEPGADDDDVCVARERLGHARAP